MNKAQLVEPQHVNPEVAGSSPALVNLSLFIQIHHEVYYTVTCESFIAIGSHVFQKITLLLLDGNLL